MTITVRVLARCAMVLASGLVPTVVRAAPPAYRVKDINPGPGDGFPYELTNVNGTLFFVAADGELWKSDGTELGTVQVKDIRPGGLGSNPFGLLAFGGLLVFGADDGTHGKELWKSDGTALGTVMVKDVNPAGDGYFGIAAVVGGVLYCGADDGVHGQELWKTDGSSGGTVLVKDINPTLGVGSDPGSLADVGGTLYLAADDGTSGRELWTSDGTPGGTLLLKDLRPGPDSSYPNAFVTISPGVATFFADAGSTGQEPWRTDGTFFGTSLLADINPTPGQGCATDAMQAFGGALFFPAYDGGTSGRELWRSDGTVPGTSMMELNPGSNWSSPHAFTVVGDRLFFGATTPWHGSSLFVSDGTVSGTYELYDNFLGYGPAVAYAANGRGRLFLSGYDTAAGSELWTSNGRTYGTYRVQDVNPTGDALPALLTESGGRLFFRATDGTSGLELWATDVLFDDGFEIRGFSTSFDPWSSVSNDCPLFCDLDFAIPGLDGVVAMQANVNDTNPLFVVDDTPDGEAEYHARFLFEPNRFDPGEALGRHRTRILLAFSDQPQRRLLTLVLARNNGAYRIILRTRRDDGTTMDLPGVPITDAPHALEVAWKRASAPGANDGTAELWIDDVLVGTLTGVDNDTGAIDFVRLGAMSIKTGASGALIYDRFESRRFRHVGPEI